MTDQYTNTIDELNSLWLTLQILFSPGLLSHILRSLAICWSKRAEFDLVAFFDIKLATWFYV